jgi:signal transduction histidine kinase
MGTVVDPSSRAWEIAFMGKVSAALTHEIKNSLAIIQESLGLMADLMHQAPPTNWPIFPRIKAVMASTEQQLQRTDRVVQRLHRLAHSMDKETASLDLNDLLREVTGLVERFARLHRVVLETSVASTPLPVVTDPFRVQYVIFTLVERAIQSSPPKGKVTVTSDRSGDWARISVSDQGAPQAAWLSTQLASALSSGEAAGETEDAEIRLLGLTIASLGGTVAAEDLDDYGNKVTLVLPAEPSYPSSA